MRDPYDVLGVTRSSSEADIKKAYRQLAKRHHPDQNPTDPKAKDRFAELNTAYEVLGDPDKKAQFDRGELDAEGKPRFRGFEGFGGREGGFENFGFSGRPPRGGAAGGPGSMGGGAGEDIFSHIFGEAFRTAERGQSRSRAMKGEDIAASLSVTLEDIASGAKKRLSLGAEREVEVTVPKGLMDGQVIRLRGLGHPGFGDPGDVLLTLRIAPHSRFTVDGSDLRQRLPVDLHDAVLGATLRVPTLTGEVEMKIPAMTSSGRTFRLRGKGLPSKDGTGDLFVAVDVRLPEEADEALLDYARRKRGATVG